MKISHIKKNNFMEIDCGYIFGTSTMPAWKDTSRNKAAIGGLVPLKWPKDLILTLKIRL